MIDGNERTEAQRNMDRRFEFAPPKVQKFDPDRSGMGQRKFGIPCARAQGEKTGVHTFLFSGPSRGGKTFRAHQIIIDGFILERYQDMTNLPYDHFVYLGLRNNWQEWREGFAACAFTYTTYATGVPLKTMFFNENEVEACIQYLKSLGPGVRKLVIFDDVFSINSSAKAQKAIADLAHQGQHYNIAMWVMVHKYTENPNVVSLRRAADYIAFCTEDIKIVKMEIGSISEALVKAYELSADFISDASGQPKRFILFDTKRGSCYDYNYWLI